MKKITFFALLLAMSAATTAQVSNVGEYRVKNDTSAFGRNLPKGTKIFDLSSLRYWAAKGSVADSLSILSAHDSLSEILSYETDSIALPALADTAADLRTALTVLAGNQLTKDGNTLNVNDGAGSGLDADYLDGLNSSYYARINYPITSGTLNSYYNPGRFYYSYPGNTITEKPEGADAFGVLSFNAGAGYYAQFLYSPDSLLFYYRSLKQGQWSGWATVCTTGNLSSFCYTIPETDSIITVWGGKLDSALSSPADTFFTTVALSDENSDLDVGTGLREMLMPISATLTNVAIYVNTGPVGADLVVDINKNGASVFSSLPTIADGDSASTDNCAFADPVVSKFKRISFDIDQVGSTTPGTGLKAIIYYIKN